MDFFFLIICGLDSNVIPPANVRQRLLLRNYKITVWSENTHNAILSPPWPPPLSFPCRGPNGSWNQNLLEAGHELCHITLIRAHRIFCQMQIEFLRL